MITPVKKPNVKLEHEIFLTPPTLQKSLPQDSQIGQLKIEPRTDLDPQDWNLDWGLLEKSSVSLDVDQKDKILSAFGEAIKSATKK